MQRTPHDEQEGRTVLVNDTDADLVYRGTFVGRPSRAVIEAMVTLEDVKPVELPVIYSDIDLDALDNLYRNPEQMHHPAELRFSLDRWRFFLSSDRVIEVYEVQATRNTVGADASADDDRPDDTG